MKALLIIDVQEAYVGHRREPDPYRQVLATINAAAAQFRRSGDPVVVIRDLSDGDDPSFRVVRELAVTPSDYQIVKYYNNSFWKTNLDALLSSLHIKNLLLCGNAAEFCVDATYFGARERGYVPSILQGGVLAETVEGLAMFEKARPMLRSDFTKFASWPPDFLKNN